MPVRNPLRRQLASTSPVPLSGLWTAGFARATDGPSGPRGTLASMLKNEHGVSGAILTGSGTEALVLAFEAAERLRGHRTTLALPAFSCFDVAAAAARFGRPVVFYDVDPGTLGPDPESLAAVARGDDLTVLIASLFGIPIDWRTIDPILADSGAMVVEDAAQGHGARWQGARLGGHGRLGVLSFGRGKGWTGGAGGALLVRDTVDLSVKDGFQLDDPAGKAELLLKAAAHWALGRPAVYGLPHALPGLGLVETHYRPVGEPRAMAPAAAQLALESQTAAEVAGEGRRTIAAEYEDRLSGLSTLRTITPPPESAPGYVRFPVILSQGMASFSDPRSASRLGAATSYPAPLPTLSQLRGLVAPGAHDGDWPGARNLVTRLVTLPTHALTTAPERVQLVAMLRVAD